MTYLEAPKQLKESYKPSDWLFLAGSITGVKENWQKYAADKLLPYFNIANPRRENFDVKDEDFDKIQIPWERKYLSLCGNIIFYFSYETVAPIALFELGKELGKIELARAICGPRFYGSKNTVKKKIYICIHPQYSRKNDVILQTELSAPELVKYITFDLDVCIQKIIGYRLTKIKK